MLLKSDGLQKPAPGFGLRTLIRLFEQASGDKVEERPETPRTR